MRNATKVHAHVLNGKVVNVSVWNGVQPHTARDGIEMVEIPLVTGTDGIDRHVGGIGWDYTDGEFVDNRPVDDDAGL